MPVLLVLLIAMAAVGAVEAPASPAESRPPSGAASLGVAIDPGATAFGGAGLVVLRVEAGSCASAMGIAAGDTLTHFDQQPLSREADLARAVGERRPGDRVELTIVRADGRGEALSGLLQAAPAPRGAALARQLDALQGRLAELEDKTREPTLAEIVQRLHALEQDLPKAAAAFKQVYPDGVFRVALSIDISSHAGASDPVAIDIGAVPPPAAPAPADPGKR